MLFIIDRFEGAFAVVELESGETVNVPRALLPETATEGQAYRITRDEHEEVAREKRIRALMDNLFD